jgi:AcrR family transcriptional regulator
MVVSSRPATTPPLPEAQQRLLEAAGEMFAERGFQDATVREICRRAGTNVAAVNYYFRGKRGLYAAVLAYAHECATKAHPADWSPAAGPPARRLRAFVGSLLARVLDEGRVAWHGKLMAREMMQPTPALDTLVTERIRPMFEQLQTIVRELLGPRARADAIRLCAFSVVGQCLHYHHARPVVARLYPPQRYRATDIARLADHITRFSLAALTGLREETRRR